MRPFYTPKIICWVRNVTSVWNNKIEARRGTADFVKRDNDGKFAYLTIKDDGFACFARAVFSSFLYISKPFSPNQRFEMTCFYSCVDDVITWRQVFLSCFHLQTAHTNLISGNILQIFYKLSATWTIRGIISKTQGYIIKFAAVVLAVVEVVLM